MAREVCMGALVLALSLARSASGQDALAMCRVNGSSVFVRTGPGTAYPGIGRLEQDEHAVRCGRSGEWARVYLPRRWHVFLNAKDVSVAGEGAREAVCVRDTEVREQPDSRAPVLGSVPRGARVNLVRLYGVWWAIEPPLSLTGYMHASYLTELRTLSAAEAQQFLDGREILALGPALEPGVGSEGADGTAPAPLPPPVPRPERAVDVPPVVVETPPPPVPAAASPPRAAASRESAMRLVPLTDSVQALWKVYVAARQGEIEEWDFSRVRSECARVRDIGTPEEREFVDRVLAEVTRLEEVQELFLRRPPVRTAGTVERIPRRDVDEPMAVGWVVGRGRHISMEGTHALTRGDRVLYYLRGEGIDLDSCVNRLVAVLSGTVEELPARYGCDLIRVSRVKVLTP